MRATNHIGQKNRAGSSASIESSARLTERSLFENRRDQKAPGSPRDLVEQETPKAERASKTGERKADQNEGLK